MALRNMIDVCGWGMQDRFNACPLPSFDEGSQGLSSKRYDPPHLLRKHC
jgi:hypothetical protein